MNDWLTFSLILVLGAFGTWLFFLEIKGRSWALHLLQPLGCLLAFSLVLRLATKSSTALGTPALLLVGVGVLITRNVLGLRHWRKTGDRTGLWSTVALDVLVLLGAAGSLYYWGFL